MQGLKPQSAVAWLDDVLERVRKLRGYKERDEKFGSAIDLVEEEFPRLHAVLLDAKAELETPRVHVHGCICSICEDRGWAYIEAKWKAGGYK